MDEGDREVHEVKASGTTIKLNRWLAISIACLSVLALLGVGTTAVFVVDQRRYNDCQRAYNDSLSAVVQERGAASDQDRQALQVVTSSTVVLVDIILTPTSTQDQRLAAVQSWRNAQSRANVELANAEEKRKQNPLPGPRRC